MGCALGTAKYPKDGGPAGLVPAQAQTRATFETLLDRLREAYYLSEFRRLDFTAAST